MIHLKSVALKQAVSGDKFPYTVPIIRSLETLEFTSEVTFLVGENGSGKSTLLEAIAVAAGSDTIGSEGVTSDKSLRNIRELTKIMRLAWAKKTHRGFFMRSEDFFGYVKRLTQMKEELYHELREVDEQFKGSSKKAQGLARMPIAGEIHAMEQEYGGNLDGYSHGESYFTLFKSRFVPDGLYLLDEPEAPLSPMRQLALLSLIKMMVDQNTQFIIATHSPILMAYPGATILNFDDGKIAPIAYDDLEHVSITRSFLNDPQTFLKHLIT